MVAMTLKNPEAEQLATELAELMQTSKTQAVVAALRAQKRRLQRERGRDRALARARHLLEAEVWRWPIKDRETPEAEMLGYDELTPDMP